MSHIHHRMLGRKSSHRTALLRNLVQSLLEHESIKTTLPKAKEAQKEAEKLITLAKKNTNASRNEAYKFLYMRSLNDKLFTTIRDRYAKRDGGYTRVLHIEPYNDDNAPSAILELVDGPKDMRFAMTAKAVAYQSSIGNFHPNTEKNIEKVIRFRENGLSEFRKLVSYFTRQIEEKKNKKRRKPQEGESTAMAKTDENSNDAVPSNVEEEVSLPILDRYLEELENKKKKKRKGSSVAQPAAQPIEIEGSNSTVTAPPPS